MSIEGMSQSFASRMQRAGKWAIALVADLPARKAAGLVTLVLVGAAGTMVLLLLAPGRTVATQHIWDVMTFVDAADRLVDGQVPNRDFHSPLGPLAYWLLAWGMKWGGLAAMMPAATALFAAALLPLTLYACLCRLPWPLALAFGLHILILAIAPAFIGDIVPKPTWGMFYNRFGYSLLSLLFLFVLPRRPGFGSEVADGAAMMVLWLLLFYLKMTYAAVGGAFLVALLWFPHARRAAVIALAGSAAGILIVELFWSGTASYIGDIRTAVSATGAVRGGALGLAATLFNNVQGVYLFVAVLLLALINRIRYDYFLLCLFMGAAGILLDRHNAQGPGILTFIPGALIAVLAPRQRNTSGTERRPAFASFLLVGALAVPVDLAAAGNLAFHFVAASRDNGQPAGPRFAGFVTPDAPTTTNVPSLALTSGASHGCGAIDSRHLNIEGVTGQQSIGQGQYLAILENGLELLAREPRLSGKVFVADLANPLNALSNRSAPTGVEAFNDAEITFSEAVHRPADVLFADVDVVMVPKYAIKYGTLDLIRRVYGGYLVENFDLVARSACWDAYAKKPRRRVVAAQPERESGQ